MLSVVVSRDKERIASLACRLSGGLVRVKKANRRNSLGQVSSNERPYTLSKVRSRKQIHRAQPAPASPLRFWKNNEAPTSNRFRKGIEGTRSMDVVGHGPRERNPNKYSPKKDLSPHQSTQRIRTPDQDPRPTAEDFQFRDTRKSFAKPFILHSFSAASFHFCFWRTSQVSSRWWPPHASQLKSAYSQLLRKDHRLLSGSGAPRQASSGRSFRFTTASKPRRHPGNRARDRFERHVRVLVASS